MAKVAVYLRVSTIEQNLDGQRAEVLAWLHQHGMTAESVAWFEDKETGKTLDRPAFTRLRKSIAAGHVETVIVQRLDRVSRKLREGLNLLHDWVEAGIRIVAVKQQIDLSGAVGRLVAAVLLGVAEMEMELRRERQMAGINARKAKGLYKGHGRPHGWRRADPMRAMELLRRGCDVREVSKMLGVAPKTVRRYWREANAQAIAAAGGATGTLPSSANGVPGLAGVARG